MSDYEEDEYEEYLQTGYEAVQERSKEIFDSATEGWTTEQVNNLRTAQKNLSGHNPPFKAVFVEFGFKEDGKPKSKVITPCFSLFARDHEPGVLSLRKLFIETDDPSGVLFAHVAFDYVDVFETIFSQEWALRELERWVKEWQGIHEYLALQDLVAQSRAGGVSATKEVLARVGSYTERLGIAGEKGSVGRPKTGFDSSDLERNHRESIIDDILDFDTDPTKGKMN